MSIKMAANWKPPIENIHAVMIRMRRTLKCLSLTSFVRGNFVSTQWKQVICFSSSTLYSKYTVNSKKVDFGSYMFLHLEH